MRPHEAAAQDGPGWTHPPRLSALGIVEESRQIPWLGCVALRNWVDDNLLKNALSG